MAMLYGVNSTKSAITKLLDGQDLFTVVMRQKGFPAFWGRSLSGVDRITKEEKEYLESKNCKVVLIFDELTEAQVSARNGVDDAMRAIKAAQELGVPANQNIALFADIKSDWSVNYNWMSSYAKTLADNGYVPGFIGNTDASTNFNFNRQTNQYVQSMAEIARGKTVYWATEPQAGGEPRKWSPYSPAALTPNHIGLWRTGGQVKYGNSIAKINYVRDKSVMNFMW